MRRVVELWLIGRANPAPAASRLLRAFGRTEFAFFAADFRRVRFVGPAACCPSSLLSIAARPRVLVSGRAAILKQETSQ